MSEQFSFLGGYQNAQPDNIFDRIGHPGKWHASVPFSGSGQVDFTGSIGNNLACVGGLILTNNTDVTIELSNGGAIPGSALALNTIHELSISKITFTNGVGYALYRNHMIR